MSAFTPKQREVLKRRLARAILWANAEAFKRDNANALALQLVNDLDEAGHTASTMRRAVANIADRLDETA